jgi:hypothetical protein
MRQTERADGWQLACGHAGMTMGPFLSDPIVEFGLERLNPVARLSTKAQTGPRSGQIKPGGIEVDGIELLALGGDAFEGWPGFQG